jgi:hypothetical protein
MMVQFHCFTNEFIIRRRYKEIGEGNIGTEKDKFSPVILYVKEL